MVVWPRIIMGCGLWLQRGTVKQFPASVSHGTLSALAGPLTQNTGTSFQDRTGSAVFVK